MQKIGLVDLRSLQCYLVSMTEVTRILSDMADGDLSAVEQLLPLVYDELRKLAAAKLAQEKPGQTLQATALVHEAYLRLVNVDQTKHWDSRGHFFAAAAESIRRILIEQARKKRGPKAGGDRKRIEISQVEPAMTDSDWDIVELSEALDKLSELDPRAASLVKLRYFAGLTIEQAAQSLGVSPATVKNDWTYAKNWLRAELLEAESSLQVFHFFPFPVSRLGANSRIGSWKATFHPFLGGDL